MAEIIAVHGGRAPGTPSKDIIASLESLLERAKAGELNGFAYAITSDSGSQATGWDGEAGSRHPLGTAIMMLNFRYAQGLVQRPLKEDHPDGA